MILTGKIVLSKADFGSTELSDVVLANNIETSFILLTYILAVIIYLYIPTGFDNKRGRASLRLNLKLYLLIYLITMLIVLVGSGLLSGGNWYGSRHEFLVSSSLAVLIAYILNAAKILVIVSLISKWLHKEISLTRFVVLVGTFTFWDMIFSGNRIYLFCTAIIVSIIYLRKFPLRTLISIPLLLPLVFYGGYFASIFRHMRGPLFEKGFPTVQIFLDNLERAMELEPPDPESFFLGISESVNVNVMYDIFNHYENYLYGATYLKTLFFYVPRSLWEAKPESITVIAAKTFGGSSLVTTIIGEMHMNFSLFGILLLPILLWSSEWFLSGCLKNYPKIFGVVLFFFGLLMFRMPYSDELLVFVFLILILFFSNLKIKYRTQ